MNLQRILKLTLLASTIGALTASAKTGDKTTCTASEAGIELGIQAWTYNRITFVETLDKCAELGVKNLQAYPGQKIGGDFGDAKLTYDLDAKSIGKILALAKAKGVTLTSYGVINPKPYDSEAEWVKLFNFAKALGLRDFATESPLNNAEKTKMLPLLIKLSKQTGVPVTLHNHSATTITPEQLQQLDQLDPEKVLGICADTGHAARRGYDPLFILKLYGPRVRSVHFKDLNQMGDKDVYDVPWGTGALNAAGQITTLREIGFKGVIYLEYERRVDLPQKFAEAALCAEWGKLALAAKSCCLDRNAILPPGYVKIDDAAAIQRRADSPNWPAPAPLFNDDLSNAEFTPGSWTYKNGILTVTKGKAGDHIFTKETYGNFALSFSFKCAKGADSGVHIRCYDNKDNVQNSLEIQILQGDYPSKNPSDPANARRILGAIFDCAEPKTQVEIEPDTWHDMLIVAKGDTIRVFIDKDKVTDVKLSKWKTPGKNPDGSSNKFKRPLSDFKENPGSIGFRRANVQFRDITIEKY
ncbi:MAG: DUF1080 domain-containing protein [Opitutaceae bacterium]|jgi:sugar phosphate isomerase/epimerase|nr:DUF1080 domain-containing protein [Opitutaceae bacterium]